MYFGPRGVVVVTILTVIMVLQLTYGLRLVIDKEECLSHNVEYDGETIYVSFVVIKRDSKSWFYSHEGADLVVKGPQGEQIHDSQDKISDKFEFIAQRKGSYKFCFTNRSPYHETIDFDYHVGHIYHFDHQAKDEHISSIQEQISKLLDALHDIQFEQHWLGAQNDRQSIVNSFMSRRATYKAMLESFALICTSMVQVYLLRRLFNKKLELSRV